MTPPETDRAPVSEAAPFQRPDLDCGETHDFRPRGEVNERWNEEFGLTCGGKPARAFCPQEGAHPCSQRFLVLVEELGEPLEGGLRDHRLCGEGVLYGCTDEQSREAIPFIHTGPIEFTASGFALVQEESHPGRRQGSYVYVDARYERRLEAKTMDGIPEPWLPLNVVRYGQDGKIGFLDLRKGIVTPSRFDSAFSFYSGHGEPAAERTLVCIGCHPQRWSMCAPPEAHCTGTAFMIDEHGNRLDRQPDEEFVEYWWCKRNPGKKFVPEPEGFCQ